MKTEEITKFYSDFKLYIFPAVVAFSSLFLIIFAIYPQTAKLLDTQKSANSLINKSKFLETKVSALESLDEVDLSQKANLALSSLPAEKDFGNIMSLLQRLIIEVGFSVTSISLGNNSSKIGNVNSYEVKLEIQGNRSMLPTLLKKLEDSPRLFRVVTINTSSSRTAEAVDVSLVIAVLYSQYPQNLGGIDATLPQLTKEDEELIAKISREYASTQGAPAGATVSLSARGKTNPFE